MQEDFYKENSVKAYHSLKTKMCKLYICRFLSGGVHNRAWIQEKAYAQFNIQTYVFFLMIDFSSYSFQPHVHSTCSSDPVVIIFWDFTFCL